MNIKSVKAKLGNMRKEQHFVVYPPSDGMIIVQSDKAIGCFDPVTGKGTLNCKGSNAKYFTHLHPSMGAHEYTFPRDFVDQCIHI